MPWIASPQEATASLRQDAGRVSRGLRELQESLGINFDHYTERMHQGFDYTNAFISNAREDFVAAQGETAEAEDIGGLIGSLDQLTERSNELRQGVIPREKVAEYIGRLQQLADDIDNDLVSSLLAQGEEIGEFDEAIRQTWRVAGRVERRYMKM